MVELKYQGAAREAQWLDGRVRGTRRLRLSDTGPLRQSVGGVRWFVVQLEYNPAPWLDDDWKEVARFDHQPDSPGGHDVYEEGLHVDLYQMDGTKRKIYPKHSELPDNVGKVLHYCKLRLRDDYEYLRASYLGGLDRKFIR